MPYNDYDLMGANQSQLLKGQFVNPALTRWEVHRVWVVNAILKPGQRHVYSQWNFYIDEDSYDILATESYDHAGSIYRVGFVYPYADYYDGAAAANFSRGFGVYDLSKGNYMIARVQTLPGDTYHCSTTLPTCLTIHLRRWHLRALSKALIKAGL